jgi:NAD(P)-dependent dehydrogenase (short-subunit alcohol dehydrogenase family)
MAQAVRLDGKVVVITGAGRGIGRAAALAMAAAGAAVVVNDIDAEAAGAVVGEITSAGGKAVAEIAPIGSADAAEACVARALSAFGRLDVMCCNAGILRDRVLWNTTDEDFDAVIETHLRGTFTCARAAVKHFRQAAQPGRLILVSSMAGQRGNFGQTAYSAAKAGIAAYARTWAMELAKGGVMVNAIVPNALTRMVATIPMFAEITAAVERGEPVPDKLRTDFGLGTAEDVAPLFVFLASDAAAGITGQCIGLGGDRLSLWSHPQEKDFALMKGGWTPDAIAENWASGVGASPESVGIKFDP